MNWKAWIPLAVAVVLGLLAARMAMNIVGSKSPEQASATPLTPIIVAARDMEAGTLLTDADLKIGKVDAESVPAGAYPTPAGLTNRVTKIALTANQPLLPTLLADDGAGWGIGATLPKGMRAVTLTIDDVTGVAGFIQPTCRVDVVVNLQADGKPVSKTVLESMQVFAVGGRTGPAVPPVPGQQPEPPARTLTLLATPEQAEKLDLAVNNGRVRLVLRNGKDPSKTASEGITIAELRGNKSSSDPFAPTDATFTSDTNTLPIQQSNIDGVPSSPLWTVEVIRAGQTSTQTFNLSKPKPTAPVRNQSTDTQIGSTTTPEQH